MALEIASFAVRGRTPVDTLFGFLVQVEDLVTGDGEVPRALNGRNARCTSRRHKNVLCLPHPTPQISVTPEIWSPFSQCQHISMQDPMPPTC